MAVDESMMWSESADPSQVSALGRKPSSQVSCSKGESQRIARIGRDLLSDTVHQLRAPEGTILLEVACSTDSVLTNMMHEISGQSGSAQRLSIWNGYDLTTNSGLKSILDKIDSLKPEHVWLSPDCGPYSIMQNVNQRSPEQCEALAEKRRDALKQYTACAVIFRYCYQRGIHCTWELSQTCQAWRLPVLQKLSVMTGVQFAIVRGCQVGLKNDKGDPIQKGWKLMTTHELMSQRMSLPCRCGPGVTHVPCQGSITKKTAFYTRAFARRVCESILQRGDPKMLPGELNGSVLFGDEFGLGTTCVCDVGKQHDAGLTCGHCTRVHDHTSGIMVADKREKVLTTNMSPEEVNRRLYLLHSATGHGQVKHLVQTLRRRGVAESIIKAAENFKCPVCEERKRPQPRNVSSL